MCSLRVMVRASSRHHYERQLSPLSLAKANIEMKKPGVPGHATCCVVSCDRRARSLHAVKTSAEPPPPPPPPRNACSPKSDHQDLGSAPHTCPFDVNSGVETGQPQ